MKKYNIVWFDDEFNSSLESIKMQFDDHQIDYEGFESAEEGIKYIQTNYQLLDAIVIDGNFFKNKNDNAIDETGKALNMVVDSLKEIKFKKDIPYFILSGKVNFRDRKNPLVDLLEIEKIYDKLKEEDTEQLCTAIIDKANTSTVGSLKIKYHNAFCICSENKLGTDCFEKVVTLAQTLENPNISSTAEDLFLPIRKMLEKLFVKLADINVIDPDLIGQKGWINGCSAFLSNRHPFYEIKNDIHPVIQDSIYRLIRLSQDSAHAEGGLTLRVDEYCNQYRSNYLFKSSVYLLFEVLTYFDKYLDDHQLKLSNRSTWKKKENSIINTTSQTNRDEFSSGIVTKIADNGFGTFIRDEDQKSLTIIPSKVKELGLKETQRIRVKTEQNGDKTYITHFEL